MVNKLLLRCPLCQSVFQQNTEGVSCINQHQFDRAKDGYFNLLPVQHKNSKNPGDTKEQLKARREFLQAGYFEPLKQALYSVIDKEAESLLDLGCGEGHFTSAFAELLPNADIYGVDIAKAGIALAAKAAKKKTNLNYWVASNFDLPLEDQSMDVIVRILAPSKDSELLRVLKSNGKLILVVPGQQHLIELRKKIYQEIRPLQALPEVDGFELTKTTNIQFSITLDQPEKVKSLLNMTPFAWKINQDKKDLLFSEKLNDAADFLIGEYEMISGEITPY